VGEPSCFIDGFGPLPVVRPESVAALGEIIHQVIAEGCAVYPIGGRTMLDLGLPPSVKGRAVDVRSLNKVIDFPARDMTVTVGAGITIAGLAAALAKEKLRLPVDVPRPEQATLGGTLAANVSGARRYGFGTLRDYIIGIGAVNDAGNEFKAGGRVVKNVAGYDLCKLLVGSLGSLGIITQVTLKLRPMPEEQALVSLACATAALEEALARLHDSRTRPVCLELLNHAAADWIFRQAQLPVPDGSWVILVGFEGNAEAVQWQVQQLIRELGAGLQAWVGFTTEPLWQALAAWPLCPEASTTFKAAVLPSNLAAFCQAVEQSVPATLRAHAGNGIVHGHLPGTCTRDQAILTLAAWREYARAARGQVVVTRCPAAWKDAINVWDEAPADTWLMRAVKSKLDPRRLFNPGRFVDGI
jgi:glycolate oxidase FAD binding subunit